MKENKGNTVLLTIIGIATLLIAVVGATFAYFTAILTGEESESTITISSGTLGLEFVGGAAINVQNIFPRGTSGSLAIEDAWATKTFTIKGTTNAASTIPYTIALVVDSNTFTADALKLTLTVDAESGVGTKATALTETPIPVTGNVALGSGSFVGPTAGQISHTYHLAIFFPETGGNQNVNQGKTLAAHVDIKNI